MYVMAPLDCEGQARCISSKNPWKRCLQETGLEQEANNTAARVAGVGGDREDRYCLIAVTCSMHQEPLMHAFFFYLNLALACIVLALFCQHNCILAEAFTKCMYRLLTFDTMLEATVQADLSLPMQGVASSCS